MKKLFLILVLFAFIGANAMAVNGADHKDQTKTEFVKDVKTSISVQNAVKSNVNFVYLSMEKELNSSNISFKGLDSPKSTIDSNRIWIDEFTDMSNVDFSKLNLTEKDRILIRSVTQLNNPYLKKSNFHQNELSLERNNLLQKQSNNKRWFRQSEFERLEHINKIMFEDSGSPNSI